MKIKIKRVYEQPDKDDGVRILVDRLWPGWLERPDFRPDNNQEYYEPGQSFRSFVVLSRKPA